jgi:NTP pyrophosphatase (non-canonical NTP hydrolase)
MKLKPRKMHCTNCGREYYQWHESCMTCHRTNVIQVKDEYKPKEKINIREEVQEFAEVMEKKLKANDYKGGWENCSIDFLTYRLREEQAELFQALTMFHRFPNEQTRKLVEDECADISNFAMMINDLVKKMVEGGK